jgi:hypothetical protein
VAANATFDAVNAYTRYQADGGLGSSRFWAGTGVDVLASAVDLRSLTGLKGATVELQGALGNPVLRYEILRTLDIPTNLILRTLGRNTAIASSVAALNYYIQQVIGSCG